MVFFKDAPPSGLLALVWMLLGTTFASAQSRHSYERAGDEALARKDYGAALHYYQTALSRKSDDSELLWKSAESARQLQAADLAERYYRQIENVGRKKKNDYPTLPLRLAEVLRLQGKYAEALECLEEWLQQDPPSPLADSARQLRAAVLWALAQAPASDTVKVVNAGKHLNSPFSDFAPFPMGDTLYFSSYRFDKRGDRKTPKTKLTRVIFSTNNGRPREAGRPFPSIDTGHVAHAVFFGGGHFLIFTLCRNQDASDIVCELWLSVKDVHKRWTTPMRLPEPVNQKGYTTTQPHIATNPASGELSLWFASDRPGSIGGLDLWYVPLDSNWFCPCHIPVDARKPFPLPPFTAPVNVRAINTTRDEVTPFFHAPTQMLYFSSNGYLESFGGFDIYRVPLPRDTAPLSPENLGRPINTSYNDLYFVLAPEGQWAYLSSNRPGAQYLDEANRFCCNDLFVVQFAAPPDTARPPATAVPIPSPPLDRPRVPIETLQPPSTPTTSPPPLKDFVGLPLFFDNDEPDRRTRRTTTRKSYGETASAYLERQAEYRARFAQGLSGAQRDSAEQQIDDFFEKEVRRGYERLEQLCEVLIERLQSGERIEIVLKGYTSPRAESDYNLALGKRRVSSVRNHFEQFSNGALLPYIERGQLTITETSFGETKARQNVSDNLRDERNSIYHPDAARERRVEIVEIR